jgi:hypothetical protein
MILLDKTVYSTSYLLKTYMTIEICTLHCFNSFDIVEHSIVIDENSQYGCDEKQRNQRAIYSRQLSSTIIDETTYYLYDL